MQKNINKDFSFTEKNTKVAPKTSNRERHRLEDVPGNFILAVISGRFKQMENYLSGFCATVVERRILVNAEDEYCRSPIFSAVFKGLFVLYSLGNHEVVDFLIHSGADPRKRDYKGRTP